MTTPIPRSPESQFPPFRPRDPMHAAAITGGVLVLVGVALFGLSTFLPWIMLAGNRGFDIWEIAEETGRSGHAAWLALALLALIVWAGVHFAWNRRGGRMAWLLSGLAVLVFAWVQVIGVMEDVEVEAGPGLLMAMFAGLLTVVGVIVGAIGNGIGAKSPMVIWPANSAPLPWQPAPPPASQPSPPARDVPTQLRELADLRDRGALTEEEFEAQKRNLIGEPPPNT